MSKAISKEAEYSPGESRTVPVSVPAALPVDVPVMVGTYFHSLDEKGRVIIPAKLRTALTDRFWMLLDENDNIGLYDYATGLAMLRHCEQQLSRFPDDEAIADSVERITGNAEQVTVESGFRVQVPEILRYWAKLDKEVVTVGVLNHAVLWSRDRWEASQANRLHRADVRRTQGSLMRAAASTVSQNQGINHGTPEAKTAAQKTGVAGRSSTGADEARASAGDGARSSGVLAMQKPGR